MITVTNGRMTLTVSKSAYNLIYKNAGFGIVEDGEASFIPGDSLPTPEDKEVPAEISDEENEDSGESTDIEEDEEEIDFSEIPLSEMSFSQLCAYAEQLELDYTGIRSKKELRALIRENL